MTVPALDPEVVRRAAAEAALFALWAWSVPDPAVDGPPRFRLSLARGEAGAGEPLSLANAATALASLTSLAGMPAPCWLSGRVEPAPEPGGPDDEDRDLGQGGAVPGGAVLRVEVAAVPPPAPPAAAGPFAPRPHRLQLGALAADHHPTAPVLLFGGRTRVRVPTAALAVADASYGLWAAAPRAVSDLADSLWASSLLPAADRAGCAQAIMLGRRVVYDPPWARDAA